MKWHPIIAFIIQLAYCRYGVTTCFLDNVSLHRQLLKWNPTVKKTELIESVYSVELVLISFSADISNETTTDNLMVESVVWNCPVHFQQSAAPWDNRSSTLWSVSTADLPEFGCHLLDWRVIWSEYFIKGICGCRINSNTSGSTSSCGESKNYVEGDMHPLVKFS